MGAALKYREGVLGAELTESALGQGRDTEAPSPGSRNSAALRLGLIQMRSLDTIMQHRKPKLLMSQCKYWRIWKF